MSRNARRIALPALVVAAALGALVAPAPASAGIAAVVTRFEPVAAGSGATAQRTDSFVYVASPFEANEVTVHVLPDAVVFRESVLIAAPGSGCALLDPFSVRCPIPQGTADQSPRRTIAVQTADGADSVTLATLQRDDVSALLAGGDGPDRISSAPVARTRPGAFVLGVLDGDAGDDVLTGGPDREELIGDDGRDALHGGAGDDTLAGEERTLPREPAPDVLDGGPGRDLLTYAGRRALAVDLLDPAPDGRAGEGDRITAVEDVEGGAGPNTLLGDDGPNTLTVRGRGRQRVEGRGGPDRLTTLSGGQLFGGPGNDRLLGDASPGCGPGNDLAQPIRRVTADCERLPVYAEDIAVQVQPLRARRGRVRLRFRPARGGVEGRRSETLRGQVRVRSGGLRSRGRLLATGRLSVPRVALPARGRARSLRLTRAGRRLVARGRRSRQVAVTISLGGQVTRYPVRLIRSGRR